MQAAERERPVPSAGTIRRSARGNGERSAIAIAMEVIVMVGNRLSSTARLGAASIASCSQQWASPVTARQQALWKQYPCRSRLQDSGGRLDRLCESRRHLFRYRRK
jgi:hypothetical protein